MTITAEEGVHLLTHPETGEVFKFIQIVTGGTVQEGFSDSPYSHSALRARDERATALQATGHMVVTDEYSDPNTTYLLTYPRLYTNND